MSKIAVMEPQLIKEALERTWKPFFSRFGSFTPIQELTIPHVLRGGNVVVISPAASGKTEAVIAPIVENLLKKEVRGMKVLYITPTRALVNDLFRRLEEPINSLNLTLGRKTGDHPVIGKKDFPNILLTTPESFDSLLARAPKIFLNLFAVILDEIHLLDNTPRGDQLRVLLIRLRKILEKFNITPQYSALSATIDDLDIGKRYFDSPQVCFLRAPREIEYLLIPARNWVREIFKIVQIRQLKKILIFFNARSLAEGFSQKFRIPPFEDRVFVHHASLPRSQREEIERFMNESDRAILLATSTLELGIDIGDLDAIILYRPPHSISSLLQRIGRGNRRTDKLFALGIYTNNWEKILFETFFDCARRGELYEKRYQPSLSIIPQQIYSYLYQRRRIGTTLKSLIELFRPLYGETVVREVFKQLVNEGNIKEFRTGIYFLSDRLENKIAYGKIHSNIAEKSFGEYEVLDTSTGTPVGRIYYLREKFILGGRYWEKVEVKEKERRVFARCIEDGPEFSKIFEGKGAGNYNYLLSVLLKQRFFPALKPEEFPFCYEGKNTYILHFFGSLYGFLVAASLTKEGFEVWDIEGKVLTLSNFQVTEGKFPVPAISSIKKVIAENIVQLEDALGSGAFFYDLPSELQVEDHFLDLDIIGFQEFLVGIELVEVSANDFRRILEFISQK
ncbi:MAG: DEAD/DEAH box helicase [candidate division WOR-3 bacterium]